MFLHLLNISLPFLFFLDCCVLHALFAVWNFVFALNCVVCSLWMRLDQWLVKISWLGELLALFWWVEMDLFSLYCNDISRSEFGGVYGFGVVLGSPSFNVQDCGPVLPENSYGVSCIESC